ncbi:MAG: F0F1 ATP synthase subunit alpha, partial [SAR324 cluster bacterium]|nr:F0F1 ATP synthase subunit alpha [SAR324 cluster bacterium]
VSIFAATNGYLDEQPLNALNKFETEFLNFVQTKKSDLRNSIEKAGKIDDASETELKSALDEFLQAFSA